MMDAIGTIPASQIAGVAAGIAALAVILALVYAIRAWRRTRRTMRAGRALLDVHLAALDSRAQAASSLTGPIADRGETLAATAASLQTSVRELRILLNAIPTERTRLRRRILDVVLPTDE